MEATLHSEVQQYDQLPPTQFERQERRAKRVGLIDRAALRIGVALVAWSRRPREAATHEHRARQLQQQRDTFRREIAAERMLYLSTAQR